MFQAVQTAENLDAHTDCVHTVATTEDELLLHKKKSNIPFIGIDLLGGDHHHPEFVMETLLSLYKEIEDPFCLLVFVTPDIRKAIENFQSLHENLIRKDSLFFSEVTEVIHMDDDPLAAIRRKKESSLSLSIRFLKEGKIDALVTTGNTGALIACAHLNLPFLKGITRSALMTLLPTKQSQLAVLDVGANVECTPETLVQFAHMGIAYQKSRGHSHPRVGLLNIGSEEKKGRLDLREAYKRLLKLNQEGTPPTFIGNVEGKEIFSGDVDILVTDGFTGNVFLKTAEGISSFILDTLHENQSILPFSKMLIERLEKKLYSAEYPGALLCGIDGLIMKCHGDSGSEALKNGVYGAIRLVNDQVISKMKKELEFA